MYVAPSFPNVHYYYYTYMLCINIHICVCLCIAYIYNNVNKFIHKKLYVSSICISPLKPLLSIKANSQHFDTEILSAAFGHISSCGSPGKTGQASDSSGSRATAESPGECNGINLLCLSFSHFTTLVH